MRRSIERDWEETVELKAVARLPDGTMGGVAHAQTNSKEYRIDPLKVVLAKSAGVKVRVVDIDAEPITSANVTASDIYPGLNKDLGGPVKQLEEGKYLMTNLVPGLDYHLTIQATGYQPSPQAKALILKPEEIHDLGDIRLEWWGKKAVPSLIKKLQSADMRVRELAANQLASLGVDAADAVPALIEKLNQDPRNTVRFSVAAALGKIGPAAKQAVPDLIRALQEDTGGGVQREAATALGLIGDPAALPSLREALKSSQFDVPKAAAKSIERLETDLKESTPGK